MASLAAHTATLGRKNARHLLRRTSFVYTKPLIEQLSTLTPAEAADVLFADFPPLLALPYDPDGDGYWTESSSPPSSFANQEKKASIVAGWWWYNAIKSPTAKYKLTHFLSTRFTVEKTPNAGSATDFYDYLRLLMFYSYGNYKTLAKKMTVNNSMLTYLNNTANNKTAPNENYAREFLELFTIGKGVQVAPGDYTTYTEADIVQAAMLLTGFKRNEDRSIIDPETGIPRGYNSFADHETASKTFSNAFDNESLVGATDAAGMDAELSAYVEMIFAREATAKNICRKMYMYFVRSRITDEAENDIITPLAQQLMADDYQMIPTLKRLLTSVHFYGLDGGDSQDGTLGAMIKSPIQQISEMVTYLEADIPNPLSDPASYYNTFWNDFVHNTFLLGANMLLFDPDNVAGHPAYHQIPDFDKNWISASTLAARYRLGECLITGENRMTDNSTIIGRLNILTTIAQTGFISVVDDPYILTSELCKALFACEPDEERITFFMNTFLLQGQPPLDWTALWSFYIEAGFTSVVTLRLESMVSQLLKAHETQMI